MSTNFSTPTYTPNAWRRFLRHGALALGLALTTTLPAWALKVDFENMPVACDGSSDSSTQFPVSYEGFRWANFECMDTSKPLFGGSYHLSATSPTTVAYTPWSGYGDPPPWLVDVDGPATLTRSDGSKFWLVSAQVTAAWNDGLKVHIEGFRDGESVAVLPIELSTDGPTKIDLRTLANIDTVVFKSQGGTPKYPEIGGGEMFALDDLIYQLEAPSEPSITPVPTLNQWALLLMGLGAAGLGARRLGRRR